jgi:predicted nucleic acid-binding protein
MIVVSDTSPLNYLVLIEQVQVLPVLFGRVIVPPAVMAELQHAGAPDVVRAWAASPPPWLEIQPPARIEPLLGLGAGETQAIRLAQELLADAILIDERRAATIARQAGLFVTGTLGVLEIAAERGLIDVVQTIAALRQTTFRVSDEVLDGVLQRDANRRRQFSSGSEDGVRR